MLPKEELDTMDEDAMGRRRLLQFMATAGAASALAGCGSGGDSQFGETDTPGDGGDGSNGGDTTETDSPDQGPQDLGKFVRATSTAYSVFDPATQVDSIDILANTYDSLLYYDANTSEIKPSLATSYDVSDDGLTWTFNLREGVQFHHGYGEFTSEDVKYTINRMLELGRGLAYLYAPVNSIDTPDDHTVVFNLEYITPLDLKVSAPFGSWIVSKAGAMENGDDAEAQNAWLNQGNDIGTGPYILEDWATQDRISLSRFEDHWRGWDQSYFSQVEYTYVTEASTKVQLLQNGDAHQADTVPFSILDSITSSGDVKLVEGDSFQQLIGQMNVKKQFTDDVNVRKALLHAFPYEAAIEEFRKGYARRNPIPIPTNMAGYNDSLTPYEYDLDRAASLIEDSQYSADELDLTLTYSGYFEPQRRSAQLLKSELEEIGVTLDVTSYPFSTKWSRAQKLETAPNIMMYLWWPTYAAPNTNLYSLFNCLEEGETPVFNLTYWCNEEYDNLVLEGEAQLATDREAAFETLKEAQRIVHENALAYTFWDLVTTNPTRAEIQGMTPNAAYPRTTFFHELTK